MAVITFDQIAQRVTIERQADRIAELERENGTLSERLAQTTPADSPGAGRERAVTPETTPGSRTRLSRRLPYVALVLAAIVLAAVAVWWLVVVR